MCSFKSLTVSAAQRLCLHSPLYLKQAHVLGAKLYVHSFDVCNPLQPQSSLVWFPCSAVNHVSPRGFMIEPSSILSLTEL